MQIPEHSWSNDEDALPIHKHANYAESMSDRSDAKRKELREEGATCDNCRMHKTLGCEFCYMFKERPVNNVCFSWKRSTVNVQADAGTTG